MRQPHRVVDIAELLQLGKVVRDGLLAVFNVPDQPSFHAHELQEPDRRLVAPAQVPDRMHRLRGVIWHATDAALNLGELKFSRENGPIDRLAAHAFPYSCIGGRIPRLQRILFGSQRLRKPWVVRPVDPLHHRTRRRADNKSLVGFVLLELRVERNPDLAVFLADRRNQHVPRGLADRLRFLNPADVHAFVGFDVADVVLETDE